MFETDRHLAPSRVGKRPPAYSMRALGRANLPETLSIDGVPWKLTRTHKHDFWAVTGFYESPAGERAVLKMGRTEPFLGIGMEWAGRFLCRREMRFYNRLRDLPSVPRILGTVGPTGFVHEYAPGAPLSKDRPVPDGFFDRLLALMRELHDRGIAYVDANKPQNILLDDSGQPHLIDFQISWDGHEVRWPLFNRLVLERMRRDDIYHVLKHKKRLRPDELTEDERQIVTRRNTIIRIHRFLTKPYFKFRRTTFKRLRESGRLLPEGSN